MMMNEREIQLFLFWRFGPASAVVIPNYRPWGWYECDFYQVTKAGFWVEYEVKVSVADFRADFKKAEKHEALAAGEARGPRRFWYVMPWELAEKLSGEIPQYAGLMGVREDGSIGRFRVAPNLESRKVKVNKELLFELFYWRFWRGREGERRIIKKNEKGKTDELD
jgi:hypothetical protein